MLWAIINLQRSIPFILQNNNDNFISQASPFSWIRVCSDSPYFEDENGNAWTPIGQNDAITWPDFNGLFKRKDVARVDGHMAYLAAHGVTCLRIMMEYCQTENRYLEKPVGRFQPNMVQFWDDLFLLCEKYQIRLLITPFDTFWMARRWKFHPYNKISGGPCKSKGRWLTCPDMLSAIKNRFSFFIERWGGSSALFGWDLFNEISPQHAGKNIQGLYHYIQQISTHIRDYEMRLYQKTHPQTVSVFAPIFERYDMANLVFQHPSLDFASTHFYNAATIDYPKNVNSPAMVTGNMVKEALQHLPSGRPFLDSEHGPINYFRRNKKGLPENFDDVYFLNIQWAHMASGAAGGGMRWPYRNPHVLTHGMRKAQMNLAGFSALIDWKSFKRTNLNGIISTDDSSVSVFGCGDKTQAIVWLLRTLKTSQKSSQSIRKVLINIAIPGLDKGNYQAFFWDTKLGLIDTQNFVSTGVTSNLRCLLTSMNLAVAIKCVS